MPTEHIHPYPENAQEATLRLQSSIKQQIREDGPIDFATYMQLALYHPQWGYYTRGGANIGKSGDFYTSVSIGACFGIILAMRIHQEWMQQKQPSSFNIIEIGANTGQLAKDILDTLDRMFPQFYKLTRYHIAEHLDAAQLTQRQTLAQHADRVHHHADLTDIQEGNGILLSNELIDAFPVHLLELDQGVWKQRMIGIENQQLAFTLEPLCDPALEAFCATLPEDLPEGYQTEFRPGLLEFTTAAATALKQSSVITIDYGHTRSSYYAPARSTGTLRCYHQHQADEKPLETPGLKDITAHIDFTQLATAYQAAGLALTEFKLQSRYLISHAREWLLSLEAHPDPDTPKLIRQFQSLTHPTTMGHQFMVLEASNYLAPNPDASASLEIAAD